MDPTEEIAALRARVEELSQLLARQEQRWEAALAVADRASLGVEVSRLFEDVVVMPLLLRLAGHGHHAEILEMLAELNRRLAQDEEMAPLLPIELRRAKYWALRIRSKRPWHGWPPTEYREDGWDEVPEDQ